MHGGSCATCGTDQCSNRCRWYPSQRAQQLEDLGIQPKSTTQPTRLEDDPNEWDDVRQRFNEDAGSCGSDGIHFNGVGYERDDSEELEEDDAGTWHQTIEEDEDDYEEDSDDDIPPELAEWLRARDIAYKRGR